LVRSVRSSRRTRQNIPAAQAPEVCRTRGPLKKIKGAGNAGRSMRPQPRVRKTRSTRASHHGSHRFRPVFPARMVLTVSFVLFPETGLSCLRHWRDAKSIAANLTPASGRQNDTTSPSAPCRSSSAYKRPSHPAPTFVTIAKRPSCGHETRRIVPLIWGNEQHRAHATNWHDGQITFRPQKKLSSAS